jgi:fructose-1,6-bisphosphatase/inositol monophosphatase family enzyme
MSPELLRIDARPNESTITAAGIEAVMRALDEIFHRLKTDSTALHKVWNETLQKHQILADAYAEAAARECLNERLPGIRLRGEESSEESVGGGGLAALLDMLDGSDLLERDFGNWCSSLVIFRTSRVPKIVAAAVGLPSKKVYYTRASKKETVFVREPRESGAAIPTIKQVRLRPKEVRLEDAAIAFVGQKPGSLLSFVDLNAYIAKLREISKEMAVRRDKQDIPRMRLYNLGGVPMMIALIEGRVNAVIEVKGQFCHDVVPGFVLALRAGAVLKGLDGKNITEDRIASILSDPKQKFGYVLASSSRLAEELVTLLSTAQNSQESSNIDSVTRS